MYDFFIAHAGNDKDQAESLYAILSSKYKVFLDTQTLNGGSIWSKILPEALENSKVVVFLLSKNSQNAYYLEEEIARSIQYYKSNKNWYNIIPLYLEGFPASVSEVPYGLYQLHSLDYLKLKNYENTCDKLTEYLNEEPNSLEKAIRAKDKLSFTHPLHEFPEGPMVDGYLVPTSLIEAFAEFIEDSYCLQIINEANSFRKEADPNEIGSILIKRINLPNPNRNNAMEFWFAAFAQARLHGPRMLAALLLTVQDTFFSKEVISEKNKLIDILKKSSNN